ncbi:hypothetical protein CU098_005712 [Rhizopus stolonifer]|uniref:Uncharacterized protein n=1 Tax=Rhizopus stolonifer TaxID=4846 RepID=A0A367J1W1_RHIST|nr:hypothetical protein CU098_005712 [Rhizopus stolonifer]
MRNKLHKLGAASSRILDIHYPTLGIVAVLIHIGYSDEFNRLLGKWEIAPLHNFNPLDPQHLRDRKLLETLTSDEERATKLKEIHQQRLTCALEYMREHARRPMAFDFVFRGWLTTCKVQSAFTDGTFRIKQ